MLQKEGKMVEQETTIALSFCRSKIILDGPYNFGQVHIVLECSNQFWMDTKHKKQFRKIQFELVQNNLDPSQIICTVQNHFGPLEGLGMYLLATMSLAKSGEVLVCLRRIGEQLENYSTTVEKLQTPFNSRVSDSTRTFHTGCIGFQKAKKLAASNLAFQAFEGFIGT